MIINNVEVQSEQHLEELIAHMDEGSKEGLRLLYQEEQS
jgi:hypothetical protein